MFIFVPILILKFCLILDVHNRYVPFTLFPMVLRVVFLAVGYLSEEVFLLDKSGAWIARVYKYTQITGVSLCFCIWALSQHVIFLQSFSYCLSSSLPKAFNSVCKILTKKLLPFLSSADQMSCSWLCDLM